MSMEKTFAKIGTKIQLQSIALFILDILISGLIWWVLGSLGIKDAFTFASYVFIGILVVGVVLIIIFGFFISMFKAQVGEIQGAREREEEKRQHPQQISITDVSTGITEGTGNCRVCGRSIAYLAQYGKYYCHNCKQYFDKNV